MACNAKSDEPPQPLVAVEAARPERGGISEHVLADATLAPLSQATVSAKISAPVRAFYIQRGSKVHAGQLIAVLEDRDLAAQALDNKGQYTAAQATYQIATEAQVPEDYSKAQLDVEQAKAALHLQEEIVASRKKLFEQGALAGRDLDTAEAARVQAQAAYDAAQNHLQALANVSRKAQLRLASGQLSSAQGKFNAAEAQVSYAHIVSPISGVVTDRPIFPGETALSGAPLATIMDTSSLLAKVHLSQVASQRLALGDKAEITIPGVDEPVEGTVSLISPAVDPGSTTVEVWLRLDNRQAKYKAGTPVHVSVTGKTIANTLKLPSAALLTAEDGSKSVMVVLADDTAHKVAVQTGINDGHSTQILSGLRGTELVITQGAYGLSEGTKVKLGEPGTSEDGGA